MFTYAQVIDGVVVNVAVFDNTPDEAFISATGGEWILIPDNLPVGIGCKLDGENFSTPDGEAITLVDEHLSNSGTSA